LSLAVDWVNGRSSRPWRPWNDVKIATLSKIDDKYPPPNKIRPIGVACNIRKLVEGVEVSMG